jgi:hypothetical protein
MMILCALVIASTSLRAHDPYEAWVSANLHPERLVLLVTIAPATMLRLIDPEAKLRGITLDNLDALRARLRREAAGMLVLTSARRRLEPRETEVELTEENDLVLTLTFPRPAAGPLHFHAAFLKKLGEGYGAILEVRDASGRDLGWEKLSFEHPNFEVPIPALPVAKPAR